MYGHAHDKCERKRRVWSWNLPEDISLDVFSRLSVKDVMICRCVCRSWRISLSTPQFINMHLTSSSSSSYKRDIVFIDIRKRDMPKYALNLVENFWTQDERLKPLLMPLHLTSVKLVGSCNGLLCLINHSKPYQVNVWNPCTGESTQFPLNSLQFDDTCFSGFGHDPVRDEYKIVTIVADGSSEVWTLGSDSWRNTGVVPFKPLVSGIVFVDGALLCLSYHSNVHGIGSFHVGKEEFQFVPLHTKISDELLNIGMLRGSCVAVSCVTNSQYEELDIWVTEDYRAQESWTRQYVLSINFIRHIEILKDWELLVNYEDKVNAAAALHNSVDENLLIEGVIKITNACAHVGTLVSPIRGYLST